MNDVKSVDALLTTHQLAERWGFKDQTLRVWRSTGRNLLPFVKVGGAVRYRLSDVEKYLNDNTALSTAELAQRN
jgi:excisionase family DNA binding protein